MFEHMHIHLGKNDVPGFYASVPYSHFYEIHFKFKVTRNRDKDCNEKKLCEVRICDANKLVFGKLLFKDN